MIQTCPVCSDPFAGKADALLLPCLHTVCFKCVQDLANDARQKSEVKPACVCCGERFEPEQLVANVTVSPVFTPASAVSILLASHSSTTDVAATATNNSVVCGECSDSTPATHHCSTCADNLCSIHVEAHRRSKRTHHHTVTALRQDQLVSETASPSTVICLEHSSGFVSVCVDCHQFVCVRCIGGNHARHHCMEFDQARKHYVDNLNTLTEVLSQRLPVIETAITNLDLLKASITTRSSEVVTQIYSTFNTIIKQLEQRRDKLASEARAETERDLKTLDLQHHGLEVAMGAVSTACQQARILVAGTQTPTVHILRMYFMVASRLQVLQGETPEVMPLISNSLCFRKPNMFLQPSVDQLGLISRSRDNIARDYSEIALPSRILGTRGNGPTQIAHAIGMDVDAQGNIVVSDYANNRLLIWNVDGTHVKTISLGTIRPFGISIATTGEYWIAARENNSILQVSPTDGTIIRQIDVVNAQGIAQLMSGNLVVSGGSSVCCIALTTGEPLWVFTALDSRFCGLALGCSGEVYVADFDQHHIKVLSCFDGRLLRLLGVGLLRRPIYVCVIPNDDGLIVSESPNADDNDNPHRVSILSMAGQRIHHWGGLKSAQPGLFNRPWGVAVLPDRSVAVIDHTNSRIQVF